MLLADGRVMVSGGVGKVATTDIFDPATDTWTTGANMVETRYAHSMTLMQDGRVLVVGGNSTDGDQRGVTTEVEVWAP